MLNIYVLNRRDTIDLEQLSKAHLVVDKRGFAPFILKDRIYGYVGEINSGDLNRLIRVYEEFNERIKESN